MKTVEELQEELKLVLKKKRFNHSVGVRYTAQSMAMKFGLDIDKAGTAGILHDCAKYLSDDKMLSECEKYKLTLSPAEKLKPSLLHAKVGAVYAREFYEVEDEEVLSAIRWHTTGKPSMSDLDKIIFIADYIEPERKILPRMQEIREMAFTDLDKTMYLILDNMISYLEETEKENKKSIDSYTVDAYDFYKDMMERKGGI